ncbi:MAG: CHAT domain-containing protein, partial [Acidobacteriota bacterium]|nr:CHAT domain-containing protein [Acidobacteriota bacterium]
ASVVACASLWPASAPARDAARQGEDAETQLTKLLADAKEKAGAGDDDAALALLGRALDLAGKVFGPDSLPAASLMDGIGVALLDKGEYRKAETYARRAVEIFDANKVLENGPPQARPAYAKSLHDLAVIYDYLGELSLAQPFYERALALRMALYGLDSPAVAESLNFLGNVFLKKGDYGRAEQLFARALATNRKLFPAEDAKVIMTLNNLAMVYDARGDGAKAEGLLKEAIASATKGRGPEDANMASLLDNLGTIYRARGDAAAARPPLTRALAIREKLLGPDDADVGRSLNNLAMVDWQEGDLKQAEQRFLRALDVQRRALGPAHPEVASVLANLALLYVAKGETKRGIALLSEWGDNSERKLLLMLATGSEEQKRLYMESISEGLDGMVSLHIKSAPDDPAAARLALTTILRRKGRVLDVMSGQVASVVAGSDAQGRALVERLAAARAQLSGLFTHGQGGDPEAYRAKVQSLESEIQTLEHAISERSPAQGVVSEPVTLDAVQKGIPEGGALVEMIRYRPLTMTSGASPRWEPPRYAAYVLPHAGAPSWVELGDAAKIDLDTARLGAAMRRRAATDFAAAARAYDEEVMRPVRKLLGDARQVLVAPDGALNFVPFAALIDEHNRYLVESYTFTYLTSGRDLIRMRERQPSRQGPVVVADPLFGPAGGASPATKGQGAAVPDTRSGTFAGFFMPLEGTAEEARGVAGVLKGAQVFTGAQALESVVKRLKGPSILHVATHGFFRQRQADEAAARKEGARDGGEVSTALTAQNALLRSGLVLAGANSLDDGHGDDGILTAMEAAGLDLHGTKLVVLSACETGVGEVMTGDGVYGLRRALVIAGTESQVISLW